MWNVKVLVCKERRQEGENGDKRRKKGGDEPASG
jgi:hypothetical protein